MGMDQRVIAENEAVGVACGTSTPARPTHTGTITGLFKTGVAALRAFDG